MTQFRLETFGVPGEYVAFQDVLGGLLNVDSDDVQASVVSPATSSFTPFNITFLVLDDESLSHDLAGKLVCAVADRTDGEDVRQTLPVTTQVYALSGSLAGQTNIIYTEAFLSALERDDQWVPSGLASATVGLPKYVAVMDEFSLTTWIVGAWSPCSNSCGEGNQTRIVSCSLGNDSACASSSSKPDVLQYCVQQSRCDDSGPFTFSGWGLMPFVVISVLTCTFMRWSSSHLLLLFSQHVCQGWSWSHQLQSRTHHMRRGGGDGALSPLVPGEWLTPLPDTLCWMVLLVLGDC